MERSVDGTDARDSVKELHSRAGPVRATGYRYGLRHLGALSIYTKEQSIGFLGLDPESTRLTRISHVQAMGDISNLHVFVCGNSFCATAGA
jgi:hypothetical protein